MKTVFEVKIRESEGGKERERLVQCTNEYSVDLNIVPVLFSGMQSSRDSKSGRSRGYKN